MNNYDLKIEFHKNCSKQILLIYSWNQSYLFHITLFGWLRLLCLLFILVVDGTGDAHIYLLGNNHCTIYLQFCQKHTAVEESSWCFHAMMVFFVLPRCKFSWTDSLTDQHTLPFFGLYYSVSVIVWFSLSYILSLSLADLIIIYSSLLLKISESSQDETESDSTNISPTCW